MFRCEAHEMLMNEACFLVRCSYEGGVQRSRWAFSDSLMGHCIDTRKTFAYTLTVKRSMLSSLRGKIS